MKVSFCFVLFLNEGNIGIDIPCTPGNKTIGSLCEDKYNSVYTIVRSLVYIMHRNRHHCDKYSMQIIQNICMGTLILLENLDKPEWLGTIIAISIN